MQLDLSGKQMNKGYILLSTWYKDVVKVSRQKATFWARNGYLDAKKRGGRWYVSKDETFTGDGF